MSALVSVCLDLQGVSAFPASCLCVFVLVCSVLVCTKCAPKKEGPGIAPRLQSFSAYQVPSTALQPPGAPPAWPGDCP